MRLNIFSKKELLIILSCFIGIGICYGIQYSFSIFFVEITNFYKSNKAYSSLIFSITLLVYGLYSPIIGILTNRYGGKKIFKVACFIIMIGLFLSSVARNINQLYFTLGVITAIGINSVGFIPVTIIISNNFPKRKGFALGLATTGVGIGAFLISIISKVLINCLGWQLSLAVLGFFLGIIIYICSYFLPENPKIKSFYFDMSIFKNKNFWFIQGGMTFGAMTTQGVMLHIVAFFIDKGATSSLAAITISIIGLIGSAGKIFWGYLTDKYHAVKLYIVACVIILISFVIILYSKVPIKNYNVNIFSLLFGIGYGSFAPLFPTLAINKFKDNFGNIIGILSAGNGIGAFFSTYFLGYIYDTTGNYNYALYFLSILVILSSLSFYISFRKDI